MQKWNEVINLGLMKRSTIAASIMERLGCTRNINVDGGFLGLV
jgi:hypothetical protein